MKVFVGTSGWMYSWNPDGLEWYLKNSGLNAVELNMSFYRFPFKNQVKGWAKKMKVKKIRWAVKVNRLITHFFKFSERALEAWKRFRETFYPLEEYIDFYLFQLPPKMGIKYKKRIEWFFEETELGERFALEPRNMEWFGIDLEAWSEEMGMTVVSVDAPDLPREVFSSNGMIYIRMHGRTGWYTHLYTKEELREVWKKIEEKNPRKVYIFFNNDHAMLENAREMLRIASFGIK